MFTTRYFDRAGNQISEQVFNTLMRNQAYHVVDYTEVVTRSLGGFKRGYRISTIWLGVDYAQGTAIR